MRKLKQVFVIAATCVLLTGCPAINLNPPVVTPGDLTIDHSLCNNSAFEVVYGTPTSTLAVNETNSAATALNACYGVGGKKLYYGTSSFIYDRSGMDAEGKYTYYVVSSNSGILHRFINETPLVDNELAKENVTVLHDGVYEVTFENGRRYAAHYLGGHEESDLAIFTIRTQDNLPWVTLGSSDDLVIGERVSAIGTPILGMAFINTTVQGVVSGLNRRYSYEFSENNKTLAISDHTSFQFDAPLNGGMEGGPVFNQMDELVGIIAYKYEESTESLSLAVPISDVKNIIDTIIASPSHTFSRVMMGVSVADLEQFPQNGIMLENGAYVSLGVYVNEISANSVATLALPTAMRQGEVITGVIIDSHYFPITNIASLSGKLWRCNQGDTIGIETKVANITQTAIITKQYTVTFGSGA